MYCAYCRKDFQLQADQLPQGGSGVQRACATCRDSLAAHGEPRECSICGVNAAFEGPPPPLSPGD